jgi:lipopolysaccharide transport system permease protein
LVEHHRLGTTSESCCHGRARRYNFRTTAVSGWRVSSSRPWHPLKQDQNSSAVLSSGAVTEQFDLVIRPPDGLVALKLSELWAYRELLYFLIWRDVKIRYAQTVFGLLWAVIQPVFTMVVFTLFFGRLSKMQSDGVPYPLFSLAALVPWTFFSSGLSKATESLVGNSNLIKKVYFPRLVIPMTAVLSGGVDFAVALALLLFLMPWFGIWPSANIVWLPALILLATVTSLGVGFWLSALTVRFRDVRYTSSFMVQLWMFCTPIAYPSSLLPEPWRSVYGLNPLAGVVEGFRWALLSTAPPGSIIWVSAIASLFLLVTGAYYFSSVERLLADTL